MNAQSLHLPNLRERSTRHENHTHARLSQLLRKQMRLSSACDGQLERDGRFAFYLGFESDEGRDDVCAVSFDNEGYLSLLHGNKYNVVQFEDRPPECREPTRTLTTST